MTRTVITYELNSAARSLFAHTISSDDYSDLLQSILIPCDLAYTYGFRWGRVYDNDLPSSEGEPVNGQGPMIDYVLAHPAAGIFFTLGIVFVSAVCTYVEYTRQRRLKDNCNSKFIFNRLDNTFTDPSKRITDINYFLSCVLRDDEKLKKKIQSICLTDDGTALEVKLLDVVKPMNKTTFEKINSKFLQPLWVMLNLSSFTYWILWISVGIFTGTFAIGVAGVSPVIAFGLPILSGLLYPAVKVYNHYKNKKSVERVGPDENGRPLDPKVARETDKSTEKSVCVLLRRALLRRMHELKKDQLKSECESLGIQPAVNVPNTPVRYMDEKISGLKKNKWTKIGVTLFAALVGTFIAAQYSAWIVLDLLNTAASVTLGVDANIILGVVLMAIAGVAAAYAAIKRYRHIKDYNSKEEFVTQDADLIETQILVDKLARLKAKILADEKSLPPQLRIAAPELVHYADDQFFKDVDRRGPTKTTLIKKGFSRLYQFINGACTGVFIGRLFLIKGSAIALPFAALSLSSPVTITLVVAIGVIYGAFKVYEYHQARKEARAELLLAQRAERMDCLNQQIELAELRAKIVSARVAARNRAPVPSALQELSPVVQHGIFSNDNPIVVAPASSPTHVLHQSA